MERRKEQEAEKKKRGKTVPAVWFKFSLRKSLNCKSELSDVHDPNPSKILTKKVGRSGCSKSISNLKDVISGSKRHMEKEKHPACSPRSIGSNDYLNSLTHEVILHQSGCELKITGFNGFSGSAFTLTPGTPGPCWCPRNCKSTRSLTRSMSVREGEDTKGLGEPEEGHGVCNGCSFTCHKCGEKFLKWESAEAHHVSKHAVSELREGDSSRKIVEIICRSSWVKSGRVVIERVLKVHNMQKTLARFEEYREMVKVKAARLAKKHPRCLADGNELLRFYGTAVACSLGANGSSAICSSEICAVCGILRSGFCGRREIGNGVGVFTSSSSGRALEGVDLVKDDGSVRKALIVCRVIAGRVHRPLDNLQGFGGHSGFDSVAGKVGMYSNIEELYLLNPSALLPCFIVICRP